MVDERQLIMLFLLIERIRGIESAWYPWINILPQAFNTPIHYGKAELAELEGTTLYTATQCALSLGMACSQLPNMTSQGLTKRIFLWTTPSTY